MLFTGSDYGMNILAIVTANCLFSSLFIILFLKGGNYLSKEQSGLLSLVVRWVVLTGEFNLKYIFDVGECLIPDFICLFSNYGCIFGLQFIFYEYFLDSTYFVSFCYFLF